MQNKISTRRYAPLLAPFVLLHIFFLRRSLRRINTRNNFEMSKQRASVCRWAAMQDEKRAKRARERETKKRKTHSVI